MTDHPFFLVYQACRKAFIALGWFSFFINMLMLIVPIYMIQIFDRVIPSYSYDTLIFLTLIALVALAVMGLLEAARSYILTRVGHWFDQFVTPLTIASIPRQIIKGDGAVLARIRDCRQLKTFISSSTILIIFDLPWAPIYLLVIFMLHPALGLISLVGGLVLLILGVLNDRAVSALHLVNLDKSRNAEEHLQATLRHAETITAMGMMPTIMSKHFIANEESLSVQSLVNERNGMYRAIVKSVRLVLQLLILGVGAYLTLTQVITSGAMLASSILMSKALAPLEQAVSAWRSLIESLQAYRRLRLFLSQPQTEPMTLKLPKPKGHIQFDKVTVMHPNQISKILDAIQFDIMPGETLVLMGASGAGKTTLAKAMLGVIEPSSGVARLDGSDVYRWSRGDFGRHVGYLPQNVALFKGTIAENISRLKEIDDEAVVRAGQMAGAHEFILHLQHGYQTPLSDVGGLSGGQLQRVALARAFYGDVKVVVLDEPNANLDEEGMRSLVQTLAIAKELKITVVLITHNVSLALKADKCMILQHGKIAFYDTPERLMERLKSNDKVVV